MFENYTLVKVKTYHHHTQTKPWICIQKAPKTIDFMGMLKVCP